MWFQFPSNDLLSFEPKTQQGCAIDLAEYRIKRVLYAFEKDLYFAGESAQTALFRHKTDFFR